MVSSPPRWGNSSRSSFHTFAVLAALVILVLAMGCPRTASAMPADSGDGSSGVEHGTSKAGGALPKASGRRLSQAIGSPHAHQREQQQQQRQRGRQSTLQGEAPQPSQWNVWGEGDANDGGVVAAVVRREAGSTDCKKARYTQTHLNAVAVASSFSTLIATVVIALIVKRLLGIKLLINTSRIRLATRDQDLLYDPMDLEQDTPEVMTSAPSL